MGDRCNVIFTTKPARTGLGLGPLLDGNLVLYSHWGGDELPRDVARALAVAAMRWNDPSYATRIMVSQIVGNRWQQETGFGLQVGELGDNEHNLIVVDFASQEVLVTDKSGNVLRRVSFDKAGEEAIRETYEKRY